MKRSLTISEFFGPTIQGEGPSVGVPCHFLRLGFCNQHCVWCDTAYTWRFDNRWPHQDNVVYDEATELREVSVEQLVDIFNRFTTPLIVISGGEPLMQARNLNLFIAGVLGRSKPPRIEIETAGTLDPLRLARAYDIDWNVSPKLSNSGNFPAVRYQPQILTTLRDLGARFKFVVQTSTDFNEVAEIVRNISIPSDRVYIMPEGRTQDAVQGTMTNIVRAVIDRGWRITPRLHIDLWGSKRGV